MTASDQRLKTGPPRLREGAPQQKNPVHTVKWLSDGPTTHSHKKSTVKETEIAKRTEASGASQSSETADEGSRDISRQGSCMTFTPKLRKKEPRCLLKPKTIFRIGYWNVRSMYSVGTLAELTKEMDRYQLDIIGVSETRWTKVEMKRCKKTWQDIKREAANRVRWRKFVSALCPTRDEQD